MRAGGVPNKRINLTRISGSRFAVSWSRAGYAQQRWTDAKGVGLQSHTRVRTVLLAWAVGIVIVSIVPSTGVSLWNLDKLGHFLAYAGLSVLVCLAFDGMRVRLPLLVGAVVLGAALELIQQFVPGRDMSLVDGLVNAAGVLTGAVLYRVLGEEIRRLAGRFSIV